MVGPPSWSLHGRGQASLRREDQNAAILFPSALERNGRERPARRSTRQFERGVRTRRAADTCRSRQKPSLELQHSSCHRGIGRQADSTCGERQSADREALSSSKNCFPSMCRMTFRLSSSEHLPSGEPEGASFRFLSGVRPPLPDPACYARFRSGSDVFR